jgi:hypothetical protein
MKPFKCKDGPLTYCAERNRKWSLRLMKLRNPHVKLTLNLVLFVGILLRMNNISHSVWGWSRWHFFSFKLVTRRSRNIFLYFSQPVQEILGKVSQKVQFTISSLTVIFSSLLTLMSLERVGDNLNSLHVDEMTWHFFGNHTSVNKVCSVSGFRCLDIVHLHKSNDETSNNYQFIISFLFTAAIQVKLITVIRANVCYFQSGVDVSVL